MQTVKSGRVASILLVPMLPLRQDCIGGHELKWGKKERRKGQDIEWKVSEEDWLGDKMES